MALTDEQRVRMQRLLERAATDRQQNTTETKKGSHVAGKQDVRTLDRKNA